jgi:hypothetical protein
MAVRAKESVNGLVVVAGVALDPVRERVHTRRRRDGGRQAHHQGRIYEGHVRADQGRAPDVELDLAPVVGDDGPERDFAAGSRRRGHRHERRHAPRDGLPAVLVLQDRPAVGDLDPYPLGGVHRAATAEGHEPVAALAPVYLAHPPYQLHVGVRPDPVEDDGVREVLDGPLREAGGGHAPVGHEQRAPHTKLLDDLAQPAYCPLPVHDAGRHLYGAHGFDFDAHTASSLAFCIWFCWV